MKTRLVLLAACLFATNVWATDDDSYSNYESIVNELKADAAEEPPKIEDNWEDVALSAGMAFITSYVSVASDIGQRAHVESSGLLKGVEGQAGANLFTKKARGEVAFRTFVTEEIEHSEVSLKELEGRLIFLPYLKPKMVLRMGFGIAARFIDVNARLPGYGETSFSQSKLATSVILGFEHKVSRAVTLGPDIAYRSSLSSSDSDKSAWDASIRLNATF